MQTRISSKVFEKKVALLIFAILLSAELCSEPLEPTFGDRYFSGYCKRNQTSRFFVSKLQYYDPQVKHAITINYLFKIGDSQGLVIEVDDSMITNLFAFFYDQKKDFFQLGDVQGGIWSIGMCQGQWDSNVI